MPAQAGGRFNQLKEESVVKLLYLSIFFLFFLATSAAAVININTGGMDELTSLPGIGPAKAEAIIKYREEKGPFAKIEDLKNVYGIGEKTVTRLKDDISVGEAPADVTVTAVNKEEKAIPTSPAAKE